MSTDIHFSGVRVYSTHGTPAPGYAPGRRVGTRHSVRGVGATASVATRTTRPLRRSPRSLLRWRRRLRHAPRVRRSVRVGIVVVGGSTRHCFARANSGNRERILAVAIPTNATFACRRRRTGRRERHMRLHHPSIGAVIVVATDSTHLHDLVRVLLVRLEMGPPQLAIEALHSHDRRAAPAPEVRPPNQVPRCDDPVHRAQCLAAQRVLETRVGVAQAFTAKGSAKAVHQRTHANSGVRPGVLEHVLERLPQLEAADPAIGPIQHVVKERDWHSLDVVRQRVKGRLEGVHGALSSHQARVQAEDIQGDGGVDRRRQDDVACIDRSLAAQLLCAHEVTRGLNDAVTGVLEAVAKVADDHREDKEQPREVKDDRHLAANPEAGAAGAAPPALVTAQKAHRGQQAQQHDQSRDKVWQSHQVRARHGQREPTIRRLVHRL
mmetsp:Transcript_80874/g.224713  ORF Transcript_80874/g.224713 Transcript_80874/m.224713 type:complete len:436 (+) Transcript_80874:381-1688(+)